MNIAARCLPVNQYCIKHDRTNECQMVVTTHTCCTQSDGASVLHWITLISRMPSAWFWIFRVLRLPEIYRIYSLLLQVCQDSDVPSSCEPVECWAATHICREWRWRIPRYVHTYTHAEFWHTHQVRYQHTHEEHVCLAHVSYMCVAHMCVSCTCSSCCKVDGRYIQIYPI
jgi:hypothetical protein